jgi:hypothetical protein
MGRCYNSTIINAPTDKVWSTIRNFHDVSWASGPIESCEAVGTLSGDQVGAQRRLNGAFEETLIGVNDRDRSFTYQITEGPSPISSNEIASYYGEVRVLPVTDSGGTFVEWSSSWTGTAGSVAEFCDPIYQALLGALKQSME